jgi:hypothetical protein
MWPESKRAVNVDRAWAIHDLQKQSDWYAARNAGNEYEVALRARSPLPET